MPSSPYCIEDERMSTELGGVIGRSLLDTVLLALWEDCAEKGLFRYDVTACATKVCVCEREEYVCLNARSCRF
jgi:hypothetical protein